MSNSESLRQALRRAGVDEACLEQVEVTGQRLDLEMTAITKGIPAKFFPAVSAILTLMLKAAGVTYPQPDFEGYFEADYFSKPVTGSAAEEMAAASPNQGFRQEGGASNG
jgi:hypothetical protein